MPSQDFKRIAKRGAKKRQDAKGKAVKTTKTAIKIILAEPRGFCFGVKRAVNIVENALSTHSNVYVLNEIVHNEHVVRELKRKGAKFVERIEKIPDNCVVVFSAHGVAPSVKRVAEKKNLRIIDATCPFVAKLHRIALQYHKRGYKIILIGHREHSEVRGISGEAPVILIEKEEDVNCIRTDSGSSKSECLCLVQTTFSTDKAEKIITKLKERFPDIDLRFADVCTATRQRQDAIRRIARLSDVVLIIGSEKSSNSRRLAEIAGKYCRRSFLIPDKGAVKREWFKEARVVGISAGASTPEYLVREVTKKIQKGVGI